LEFRRPCVSSSRWQVLRSSSVSNESGCRGEQSESLREQPDDPRAFSTWLLVPQGSCKLVSYLHTFVPELRLSGSGPGATRNAIRM
jgi:hypothetical protein